MSPKEYYSYLKSKSLLPQRQLSDDLLMSFMPSGLDAEIWSQAKPEKFFLGQLRSLTGGIECLTGFGIGGPAARIHLALAIEAGAKNVVFVGTVGALSDDLQIGDLVHIGEPSLDMGLSKRSYSTVFDPFEAAEAEADIVEMEASYLFAWCQKQAVNCTGVGVVSDLLRNNAWEPGFDKISDSLGRAHRLAYEALRKV